MDKTCEERIDDELEYTLETLHTLWDLFMEDSEAYDDDLGNMYEYGLCFDYVAPHTFDDQDEGYFRYQLSTGGPGDEFRFFATPEIRKHGMTFSVYRIEYWFLDWWDGAHRIMRGSNLDFLKEIFTVFFDDCSSTESAYNDAMEDYEEPYEDEDEDEEYIDEEECEDKDVRDAANNVIRNIKNILGG